MTSFDDGAQVRRLSPLTLRAAALMIALLALLGFQGLGSSARAAGPLPVVLALDTQQGGVDGGTSLTIYGSGFTGATEVDWGVVRGGIGKGVANGDSGPFVTGACNDWIGAYYGAQFTVVDDHTIRAISASVAAPGTVDVFVVTPNGRNLANPGDHFTYVASPAPVVRAVDPGHGVRAGGNSVTICGTGFGMSSSDTVHFGSTTVSSFANSDNTLIVTAPAGLGTVDVTVTTSGGTSAVGPADRYTYSGVAGLPVVSGISPHSGYTSGATSLSIYGSGLLNATAVYFGTARGVINSYYGTNPDTTLGVTSPAHALGTVDVTVASAAGVSVVSAADKFTYVAVASPVIQAIDPHSGLVGGGDRVSIMGTGFTGATAVNFGGTPATVSSVADGLVTVVSPAGSLGNVDIVVVTPRGSSSPNASDVYTYVSNAARPPVVNALSLNSGYPAGGDSVTILGSGLTGVSAVHFGSSLASISPCGVFCVDSELQVVVPAGTVSTTVDVTVTRNGVTSALSTADHYSYIPNPTPAVYSVNAAKGPLAGGTPVIITGTGLSGASVTFGGVAATVSGGAARESVSVTSPPAASPGTVDVVVTTPGGTSATGPQTKFTYANLPPRVDGISINHGVASGGNSVSIYGMNLVGATAVNFGAVAATIKFTTGNSFDEVDVSAPAGTVSTTVDVTVTTPGGTSPTGVADKYTYQLGGAPSVAGLAANSGPAAGSGSFTIYGSSFTGATAVSFGGTAGVGMFVQSDTAISISAPAHALGVVDVTVTNGAGTSGTSVADQFTYVANPVPAVTGVSPQGGPGGGGSAVTILGSGFTDATSVSFGPNAAFGLSVIDDHSISTTAPAGTGTVNVVVTGPGGSSAIAPGDAFTYTAAVAPTISGIGPASGPAGTAVYISGTGFNTGITGITFGGTPTASLTTVISDNLLSTTSPAGPTGSVAVAVSTSAGTATAAAAYDYSTPAPTGLQVYGLSPNSGTAGGGAAVTIYGNGFSGVTAINFGTTALSPGGWLVSNPSSIYIWNAPAGLAGSTVDVTVTVGVATSPVTTADHFTYLAVSVPVIDGVAPNAGYDSGGQQVSIYGHGLSGVTTVTFGGNTLQNYGSFSDTRLTTVSPAGSIGTVHIAATSFAGTSVPTARDQYTYIATPQPTISAISPAAGSASGGDTVYITGRGLDGPGPKIAFGFQPAFQYATLSPTLLQTVSPVGTASVTPVDVSISTAGGQSPASSADLYTYTTPPTAPVPAVTAVSANTGTASGTNPVFITGAGLGGVTSVTFGAQAAVLGFLSFTDNLIQVSAPAGTASVTPVDVRVITGGGTSPTSASDKYTYTAAPVPTITAIGPATGPASGGTQVAITGTGLTGLTGVTFGGVVSAGPYAASDTLAYVSSPPGSAGPAVDTRVTTPGGTSAVTAADHFTYSATPLPSVTTVSPSSGYSAGGDVVYVTGTGLGNPLSATSVSFGSTPAPFYYYTFLGDNLLVVSSSPPHALGTVDITVTVGGLTSATVAADHFTFNSTPLATITSVSPAAGTGAGGDTVYIEGSNLNLPTSVNFGLTSVPALNIVASPGLLVVTSPPHAVGLVDITLTDPGGTSAVVAADRFTFTAPAVPAVTAVNPATGTAAGNQATYVTGSALTNASVLRFGATTVPIANWHIIDDGLVQVSSTPPGSAGPVDVRVTAAGGQSPVVPADQYTYSAPPGPVVSVVSPATGTSAGGTVVFISGTGLNAASGVQFGATPAAGVAAIDDNLVRAVSPAGSTGTVDIRVTTPGGITPVVAADHFAYIVPTLPVVQLVSPSTGSSGGGTTVYIEGANFSGTSAVVFGLNAATAVTVLSDGLLRAVSPAGTGTPDVRVTAPAGQSAINGADVFTYGGGSPRPAVSGLSPTAGPAAGGTAVTITGSGFTGATAVAFGATPAVSGWTVVNDTTINATSPAGTLGTTVDVTVSGPGGTSLTGAPDHYTYTSNNTLYSVVSTQQYTLTGNNGTTWVAIDATNLVTTVAASANSTAVVGGNLDVFTNSPGYNQDIGLFVSDNGGADAMLAWKESGGFAGTYSPNAAFVQTVYSMSAGHSYVFKLKWKTNSAQPPGAAIFAGAGPSAPFSPTRLTVEVMPSISSPATSVSTQQYTLSNNDGNTWVTLDGTNLVTTVAPAGNSAAVLGGNVDLFTSASGYNQDIGIFVSDNGGADQLVAWKESGGYAGTYSPNAAFVQSTYAMTGGHSYAFRLKWKTNKAELAGVIIYAGAGGGAPFSPTRLTAEAIPAGTPPATAVSTQQYTLAGNNGSTWANLDATNLVTTVAPSVNQAVLLGANVDLFTNSAGYNQDIGIFVSDNGGADQLLGWKESGGFAGTYSPNAAFVQSVYAMTGGHSYVFKLKWKTNNPEGGGVIVYAAAGAGAPFSPTRLTAEVIQ